MEDESLHGSHQETGSEGGFHSLGDSQAATKVWDQLEGVEAFYLQSLKAPQRCGTHAVVVSD